MPDVLTWVDPAGGEHLLDDPENGLKCAPGKSDFYMPPVVVNEMAVPGVDGAAYLGSTIPPRELDLPFQVFANDEITFRARLRTLMGWFNPRVGDGRGTLKVAGPDGGTRAISAYYAGGLGLDEPAADKRNLIQRCTIILRCLDPFWTSSVTHHETFESESAGNFFPFFPMNLGAGLTGDQNIVNEGDVDAWPVWTLSGPFTNFQATNNTTGLTFTLTHTALTGETAIIDTRPTYKTVASGAVNLFGGFVGTMWPLKTGGNDVTLAVGGADADSLIDLDFAPRFLAP